MYEKNMMKQFDKIYSDGRALEYISAYWSAAKTAQNIRWLNEPRAERTLRDCFLREFEAAEDFVSFATDRENAEKMLTV